MIVTVANINLCVTGEQFFKSFSDSERDRLRPFIRHDSSPGSEKGKIYRAHICLLEKKKIPQPTLRKKRSISSQIKLHFDTCPDRKLKTGLSRFIKQGLPYCNQYFFAKKFLGIKFDRGYSLTVSSHFVVLFKHDSAQLDVFFKKPVFPNPVLDQNLRVLRHIFMMILSASGNGVILHASSVEINRTKGYVFIGPSGSGKSTAVSLLKPERTLSDDSTAIRKSGKRYYLYANPWWNADRRVEAPMVQRPVRLRALFFIQKAKKTALRKMSYKESLATLFYRDRDLCLRGLTEDKNRVINFYLFSKELVRKVPCFDLKIKKSPLFRRSFSFLSSRI